VVLGSCGRCGAATVTVCGHAGRWWRCHAFPRRRFDRFGAAVSAAGEAGGRCRSCGQEARGQAAGASARMRESASAKACCQGQRAGRCSVQRRALRVSRPGRASSRRLRVRTARTVWPGQADHRGPARQVERERGVHRPDRVGVEAPGREVRERLVFEVADRESTTACWRCSASAIVRSSLRLVMNGNSSQVANNSPSRSRLRTRRTTSRRSLRVVSAICAIEVFG
jgi:hypothetical protein